MICAAVDKRARNLYIHTCDVRLKRQISHLYDWNNSISRRGDQCRRPFWLAASFPLIRQQQWPRLLRVQGISCCQAARASLSPGSPFITVQGMRKAWDAGHRSTYQAERP